MIVRYGQLFVNYYTSMTYQQLVIQCLFFLKPETSAGLLHEPSHGTI